MISDKKQLFTRKEVWLLTKEAIGLWRDAHDSRIYKGKDYHGKWFKEKTKKK